MDRAYAARHERKISSGGNGMVPKEWQAMPREATQDERTELSWRQDLIGGELHGIGSNGRC